MGEKRKVEGVEVEVTGHKKWEHAYELSDMEVVYRRGQWHSWDDVIHWLETEGEKDNELTPGEVIAMTEDLRHVRDAGVPFTNEPREAFDLVFKHGVGTESRR